MADSEEQLIALLDQTCNPVSSTQLNAEKELNKLFEKSWETTLLALARIASSSEQSQPRRQLAQILVANQLRKGQSKYSKTKQEWRDSISKLLDNSPRAAVELAVLDDSLFDDHSLLSRLVKSCAELKPADVTKDSEPFTRLFNTLRIISGFCENGCSTLPERNAILTLVVNHIAAATACKELLVQLGDTLSAMVPFISHNLAIPAECKMIIVTLGKLSSHSDPDVRAKGVAGMTAIAEDHLKLLLPFMSAIFTVHTKILRAAENGPDTLQVLEFWTTVLERASDEDREAVVGPAAKELAIIILKDLIVWHEEGDDGTQSDQDEWNQRQAAGVLLSHLLSDETASPIVLPQMMAFAESHLASKDWSSRSATCLALGAWFAGCNTPEKIISMTAPVFTKTGPNSLWGLLEDPIPRVQEDAAWALAQVCQLGEDITEEVAAILVPNFTKSLSSGKLSPPAIASLCWGLSSLCSMYDESNTSWNASALSGDMQKIAELGMVLLQKTPDYRPQITDMVISLVRAIPSEGVALLNRMLSMYGAAAHSIVKAPQADPAIAWPLAPSLAIIAAIMQKEVVQQDSTKYFGPAMSMAGSAISFCRANPIDELSDCVADAFSIVTAMVPVAPASFQYQPLVTLALSVIQSSEDSLASKYAALLTLSEIATRGKEVVSPFALKIMQCVITLCASTQTPKTLKPPALHLIGDLVLAVESEVAPALPTVCQMLCGALDAVPDMMSDQENQEFVSDLMEAALDSVSSLALTAPADLLKPFAQTIVKLGTGTFKFFERHDPDHNDEPIFSKSINALFNCFADLDNKIGLAAQAPLFKSHASKFSLDPTISSRFWQRAYSGSGSLSVADDDSPSTPTIEEDM